MKAAKKKTSSATVKIPSLVMALPKTRYQSLVDAVQLVRHDKKGTNKQLAAYCGLMPSQTSAWFWSATPSPTPPRASVTFLALQWVCDKMRHEYPTVDNLLLSEWETLRYFLFRLCYGELFDLERTAPVFGTDSDGQLCPERSSVHSIVEVSNLSEEQIKALVPYPWGPGTDPDGNFGLGFLAIHLQYPNNRRNYFDFLISDLEPLGGKVKVPLGFPGGPTKEQKDLVARAEKLRGMYRSSKPLVLPEWLSKIVL